jgi:hypothetical protein
VGHRRKPTPVLPRTAQRILAGAKRLESGCLISDLAPSQERPIVTIPGRQQMQAARVVKAIAIGRTIEADEEVHHAECRNVRCVEPSHLVVLSAADHQAHHAAERRQERCSVHNIPYARRNAKGWGICRKCAAEASARYYQRNPPKPLTEAQRLRSNELNRIRRNTPEGKAKRRAQRARRKALKAQREQVA